MEELYYTTIIPKGTLLFRSTNSTIDIVKDFAGIPKEKNSFCLYPNFNVFFYPYPFVSESVKKYDYTCVYVLNNDVKLINLISPSPYVRKDKANRKGGIISCDLIDTKGCALHGRSYDPCIDFEKVSDKKVVGMLAIAKEDAKNLKKLLEKIDEEKDSSNNNNNNIRETKVLHRTMYYNYFYKLYKDSRQVIGVPEIILYPRKEILNESRKEKIEDFNEWLEENEKEFNFSLFQILRSSDELKLLMSGLMSDEGVSINKKIYKVAINKETGFFQLVNKTNKTVLLDYDNDLSIKHKEFKFVSANLEELDLVNGIRLIKKIQDWVDKNNEEESLNLSDLELTKIPELPINVKILNLSNNKIENIENLPKNLTELNLDNNKIRILENIPNSVHTLNIDGNKLTDIKSVPKDLEILNISSNRLTNIDNLPNTLKSLNVSYNEKLTEIKSLPTSLLQLKAIGCYIDYIKSFPKNLIEINLNENNLSSLPELPKTLISLEVEGNQYLKLGRIPNSVKVLKYDEPENINISNI